MRKKLVKMKTPRGPKKGRSEPWAGLPPCITAGQDSKCLACYDGIPLKEHNDF